MTIKTRTLCAGHRGARFLGMVFLGIIAAVAFALLFGLAVQYIWNWLMPDLFGLKAITYLQAFAMVILAKILFGGFGRHGRHHPYDRSKYKFKLRMNDGGTMPQEVLDNRESFESFWQEEGRDAFKRYMKTFDGPEADKKRKD